MTHDNVVMLLSLRDVNKYFKHFLFNYDLINYLTSRSHMVRRSVIRRCGFILIFLLVRQVY